VVAVRDQGPGIPESGLGRLFKRCERVQQGRPSKLAAGIGLGLVFIDTVARCHGAQVKVINKPGAGDCFELWPPIDPGLA
jgi:K+-sensing histidine kinase KdpD